MVVDAARVVDLMIARPTIAAVTWRFVLTLGPSIAENEPLSATFSDVGGYLLLVTANDYSGDGGGFDCCTGRSSFTA